MNNPFRFLAILCFAVFGIMKASAETNLVWSPVAGQNSRDNGTWQCATPTTRVLTGSSYNTSTITTFQQVPATGNVYICTVNRPIGAGEGCDGPGAGIYDAERMAVKSQANTCAPPPTCPPPQPAQESRTMQCPTPLVGEWTQTRTYSCSAPNWVAGPWLPADPPAGVCAEPPPQGYAPVTPYDIDVHVSFHECSVSAGIYSPFFPQFIEAQLLGSPDWIRAVAPEVTKVTCAQLGITAPGQVIMVRLRAVNNFGASNPTGYWPVVKFNPQTPDVNAVDIERIEYSISKNRVDSYTQTCPEPSP